jgi:hypothetical protein
LIAALLLFGQTAAVAVACQRMDLSVPGGGEAIAAAGAPCSGHAASDPAPEHPLLCKAHCQADQQSVNSGSLAADVPSALLLGPVLWHLPDPADSGASARPALPPWPAGPPAGSPPLYLSLLVLRN